MTRTFWSLVNFLLLAVTGVAALGFIRSQGYNRDIVFYGFVSWLGGLTAFVFVRQMWSLYKKIENID